MRLGESTVALSLFLRPLSFQHCSLGKTVYAPQIVSLACGGSSSIPKGYWYHYSYGTIAMYKQDWHNFGGFSQAFSNKSTWGGEDWDIIDNAVRSGLEIERKRSQFVYHYHHSKVGMWWHTTKKKVIRFKLWRGWDIMMNRAFHVSISQNSRRLDILARFNFTTI